MDYFCKVCAGKPGWAFDDTKAFNHSCQRCFQFRPCNDYGKSGPKVSAAPVAKDFVPQPVATGHAECNLPKAKGLPVSEVRTPQAAPQAAPEVQKTEADMALDALQPNRPGIKLTTKPRGPGPQVPPAKEMPKFEVAPAEQA